MIHNEFQEVTMNNLSYISSSATIGKNVSIGRFCVIEDNVVLEDGVILEDYALVQSESRIGARTKVGTYCKVGHNVSIGSDCSFTSYCEIRDNCHLGSHVSMGSRCTLSANTNVGDGAIMKYAFVLADTPVLSKNNEKVSGSIGARTKFGANVTVMPGVHIGDDAEIGACSQVRHNVPNGQIWFGNPAKYLRDS